MCESCSPGVNRREFLAAGALSAAALSAVSAYGSKTAEPALKSITKKPAKIMVAFLFPPLDVVEAGKLEDNWAKHRWSTWPGNQFLPEEQRKKFTAEIRKMAEKIGVDVEFAPASLYTSDGVKAYIAEVKKAKPDAVLLVNFWNTFSKWTYKITQEVGVPSVVYHAVGANHQLPPKDLMEAEGIYYIHSIENWEGNRPRLACRSREGDARPEPNVESGPLQSRFGKDRPVARFQSRRYPGGRIQRPLRFDFRRRCRQAACCGIQSCGNASERRDRSLPRRGVPRPRDGRTTQTPLRRRRGHDSLSDA